jgi:hypothetical protein
MSGGHIRDRGNSWELRWPYQRVRAVGGASAPRLS